MDIVLFKHINELGECRGNPNTRFILHALITLAEHLFNDKRKVLLFLLALCLIEIHKDRNKRRLTVGGHQSNHLILDGLNATGHLIVKALLHHITQLFCGKLNTNRVHLVHNSLANLAARNINKRSKVSERNGLAAVLAGRHLCNDLCCNVTRRREAVWTFNKRTGNDRAVLKHIVKIDKIAVVHVLRKVIRVMEVNETLIVSLHNILWQKLALNKIFGNLTGHIVTLYGNNSRILIGILLFNFFVVALYQRKDLIVCCIFLASLVLYVSVDNVLASHLKVIKGHQLILDKILDFFYRNGVSGFHTLVSHIKCSKTDLTVSKALLSANLSVCLSNSILNFIDVKRYFRTVALDNLHELSP